ncbi:ACP S-malonyltransferase [Pendulispora brunnea]|uniref:[acyl-carrier-protein] S-malonyltransferase n=1 Tax=Pendulispora brunnea TaxID=2905690 RepID=A0ABZ2KLG0_9BACT
MVSTTNIVFMFSGQGSQYFQMGQELYDRQPVFRQWMDRLDVMTRELSGTSVVEALYKQGRGKGDLFDRTLLSHPALFMVEYSLAKALIESRVQPHMVLGASLGTFTAASIAGCMDVEDALKAVIQHAKTLESFCEPGAMIAVLAPLHLYDAAGLHRYGELAAVNFEGNFVIAVRAHDVSAVEGILRGKDVTFRRLPVSFAFHSRWIDPAELPFKRHVRSTSMRAGQLPVVSCATRSKIPGSFSEDHLWSATREPIRFLDTIRSLEASGPHQYVDMDPAGTLATFIKYIQPQSPQSLAASKCHSVFSPFGKAMDRLGTVTDALASRPIPVPAAVPVPAVAPVVAAVTPVVAVANPIAFMFPGQGSQKRGMGAALFDSVPQYASVEREVDALLGYSLRRLCVEDPENVLKESQFTQPALYMVNALHYYEAIAQGVRPHYVAGHSLGEYDALLAAGSFDLLTGLRLVKKRGELMGQAKSGGMAAVIGLEEDRIQQVLKENDLASMDIANFNSPGQIVISGPLDDVTRAKPIFEKSGARVYIPLPVGAAFHSRYVADAARAFGDFLAPMEFDAPRIPVISNVTAMPYETRNASATIKSLLIDQITRPVQWMQSMNFLMEKGVRDFREVGPGNVLTKIAHNIQKAAA